MKIIIRQAKKEDVGDVRFIQSTTWQSRYEENSNLKTEELIGNIESGKDPLNLVAEVESKVVGWLSVNVRESEIESIYVLDDFQRKGIGQKLMKRAFEYFEEVSVVQVKFFEFNENAKEFYEKLGFVGNGYRGDYELDDGMFVPMVEMEKVVRN